MQTPRPRMDGPWIDHHLLRTLIEGIGACCGSVAYKWCN